MSLPIQKLPFKKKTKEWGIDTLSYYERLTYSSGSSNRNSNYEKKINYDLFNGKFNKADLEYVCNPLGTQDNEYPATLQHYDIVSPAFNLLIGEECTRPDNCIVISESPLDITRKQENTKAKIIAALQELLIGEIDPSTIDPNNPPPTPEEIIKYEKYNISDIIESQGNKIMKHLKKYLNTKEVFKKGWKDVLLAGEEIYWVGITNNEEVTFRRCNPLNTTIILDGDTDYVDDAQAVAEVRLLSPSSIVDEFGADLSPAEVQRLEDLSRNMAGSYNNYNNQFQFNLDIDRNNNIGVVDTGIANYSSTNTSGGPNSRLIRVVRVEWKSFKKLYHLKYTDEEGIEIEKIVDESFELSVFKQAFPDAKTEEFWINEVWEGVKIGTDIYVGIKPKENQRRRMDNPYYCKLGYVGLIYNATNSKAVSLMDRLKPYQYLYNIISYRLELAFASDQGKIMLMDLAQIPRSEGIDINKWMYYMKAMKIAFINSHEEGRKGSMIGKVSNFNQFQSIDMSLANTINQYISTLEYIKQQTAFISGVTPQRLGAISNQELVGNVERSVQQSAMITEYLFDSHDEVKRRAYVALIECAKIAYRNGKKVQYILDDMGLDIIDIAQGDLDNTEFNVFVSRSQKDRQVQESLKQLMSVALQSDKADLSTMIDSMINDSPRDIVRTIQRGEEAKQARDKAVQDQQMQMQQQQLAMQKQMHDEQLFEKQKDRDLQQYIADSANETKIQTAEINVYSRQQELDANMNGIPDPMEIAAQSLKERDIASKSFMEQSRLMNDKEKANRQMNLKEREIQSKQEIENKKLQMIREQNNNQIELANKKAKLDKEMMDKKMQLEKLKLQAKNKNK